MERRWGDYRDELAVWRVGEEEVTIGAFGFEVIGDVEEVVLGEGLEVVLVPVFDGLVSA